MKPDYLLPNRALERIAAGELLRVYSTGNFATPRTVDFIGRSGHFDVIWFDLEHFEIPDFSTLAMIARGHGLTTLARIKATDYQSVMRPLEAGADALMCAMVADAAEARQIVEWAKFYLPDPAPGEAVGKRGWNGGNIDACYGNLPAQEYIRHQNRETILLCQIEHDHALERAGEIAAVSGVNGLFFGPGDYSASRGLAGQIAAPCVMEAMGRVAEAVRGAGKWWGSVAVGAKMWNQAAAMGAQFLCPGGDVKIMNLGLKELVKTFEQAPAPTAATPTYA